MTNQTRDSLCLGVICYHLGRVAELLPDAGKIAVAAITLGLMIAVLLTPRNPSS